MNPAAAFVLGSVMLLPLVLAFLALVPAMRRHSLSFLPVAPLPGLFAALFAPAGMRLAAPDILLGATLAIDGHGRIFLGFAALLWMAAGLFARHYMRDAVRTARFSAFWCLTLAGNLGVFVAGDVVSFYAAFACVSLAAYPLIIHDRSAEAMRAGRVYIVLAIIGETSLLTGFMLGASGSESLLVADVRSAIAASPHRDAALLCLVGGFGIKAGLVPLHAWLPLAHPAAPTPASAVLSGAIVKAGIFGLMQFLPFGIVLPGWHEALLAAGLATAWFGIAAGLTQGNAKTILAYSTISQMGIVAAVLAMALREGAAPEIALAGASLYALHHGFAKGALFMGVALAGSGVRMLAILALPALSIAGFPLTGGALAKLAIKPSLGAGMAELLVSLSAVGTSLLLLRFLCVLASRVDPDTDARSRPGVTFPWLFTIAAALVLPWALFATHSGQAVAYALSPGNLWSALWPLVVAGLIAAIAWRARMRTPRVPPGDLLAAVSWMRRRFPSSPGPGRLRATLRASFERARDRSLGLATDWSAAAERLLSRWSVGGTLVLVVVLFLASCGAGG